MLIIHDETQSFYDMVFQVCNMGMSMKDEDYYWENWDLDDFARWQAFVCRKTSLQDRSSE